MAKVSLSARIIESYCDSKGYPTPCFEVRFHPERRWRFDLGWPTAKVALEIEGVSPAGGRHQRIGGFTEDCEKYSRAACLGWRVVRVTPRQIQQGLVYEYLDAIFGEDG